MTRYFYADQSLYFRVLDSSPVLIIRGEDKGTAPCRLGLCERVAVHGLPASEVASLGQQYRGIFSPVSISLDSALATAQPYLFELNGGAREEDPAYI